MEYLEANIQKALNVLLPKIQSKRQASPQPVILGVTGLQGSGKSTWASKIVELLSSNHNLRTVTISLDDLYKTHDDLIAQRNKDPDNKLYRTRGQPGTHDEHLAAQFFSALKTQHEQSDLKIPRFDKSKFNGEGDRAPESEWPSIHGNIDVVVFEGWCVGFQALPDNDVEAKHREAQTSKQPDVQESITTLADHSIEHLKQVNNSLKAYNEAFMGTQYFDFMIHIDTDDLRNVYRWRLQQEHAMIEKKGTGMSDEAVVAFVRGYMPAYELYLEGLRKGVFREGSWRQVRVLLARDRGVQHLQVL